MGGLAASSIKQKLAALSGIESLLTIKLDWRLLQVRIVTG